MQTKERKFILQYEPLSGFWYGYLKHRKGEFISVKKTKLEAAEELLRWIGWKVLPGGPV